MLDIFEDSITAAIGAVDKTGRMSLYGAFNYFQDAAVRHAAILGVGLGDLEQSGQAWILSRMSVLMERRPGQGEAIKLRTWPRGSQKLFFIRDYDIIGEGGAPAVRGRSGWIIIDIEKKRPLRPEGIIAHLPLNEGRDSLPGSPAAIAPLEGLSAAGSRRAAYSDIDINGHVNNARYVQWIEDVLAPVRFYEASGLRLDINYISEVTEGETVDFWTGRREGRIFIEGRREGAPAFRAELEAAP